MVGDTSSARGYLHSHGLVEPPIRPNDCVVLVGIPTTLRELREDVRDHPKHDFALSQAYDEESFREQIVEPARQSIAAMENAGARVKRHAKLSLMTKALESQAKVVIIISHYSRTKAAIEFSDGMKRAAHVIAAIPPFSNALLDLSACQSIDIGRDVAMARPMGLVRFAEDKLDGITWLYFFMVLMKVLAETPMTYYEALIQTHGYFRSRTP